MTTEYLSEDMSVGEIEGRVTQCEEQQQEMEERLQLCVIKHI